MGGVFFIDEVNSKRGASVMGKRACPRLSAWVFLLLRKLVLIGEFGANDRVGVLTGDKYAKHRKGRLAYYDYLMNSAFKHKVVPVAWDTGHEGENNMTIIRRQSEPIPYMGGDYRA